MAIPTMGVRRCMWMTLSACWLLPQGEPPRAWLSCYLDSPDIIISLMRAEFEAGRSGEDFKVMKESGVLYGVRCKVCGKEVKRGESCH